MAKSLRSKRKRMLRNIKRKRYAVKELARLKKMLGLPVSEDTEAAHPPLNVIEYSLNTQAEVKEEPVDVKEDIGYTFSEKGTLILVVPSDEESNEPQEEHKSNEGETEMDHSQKKMYDRETMKDEEGKYPAWFTQKDIKNLGKKLRLSRKLMKKQMMMKAIAERKKKTLRKRNSKKWKARKVSEQKAEEKSNAAVQSNEDQQSTKMELECTNQNTSE